MTQDKMAEQRHTTGDIWRRIDAQSAEIGNIAKGQVATDARLGALEHTVEDGFRSLTAELRGLREDSKPKPTNVMGIAGIVFGLLAMFGSYSMLLLQPERNRIDVVTAYVEANREKNVAIRERLASVETRLHIIDEAGTEAFRKSD